MKKLLLFMLLLSSTIAQASHEYAAQISMNYLTSGSYEVKVTLWVDSMSPNLSTINYYAANSLLVDTQSASQVSSTNIGNGILERTYLDTLMNNALAGSFKVFYQNCCRGNLDNVINSSATHIYTEAAMNLAPAQINSSPDFLNTPQFFEGIADTLNHNPLAADADGDSLVYTLVTPMGSNATPVMMTPTPYPSVSAGGAFTIDAALGNIFWVPSMAGTYGYAVKVEEYRNGVLLGHSIRDARVSICQSCKTTMASDFTFDNSNWNYSNNYPVWDVYEMTPFTYTYVGNVSGTNTNTLDLSIITQADILSASPLHSSMQNGTSVNAQFSWTPGLGLAAKPPIAGVLLGKETNLSNSTSSKEQTVVFNVLAQQPTSLQEINYESGLNIFPNPALTHTTIKVTKLPHNGTLQLLSIDGKVVRQASIRKGTNIIELDMSNLQAGLYIVSIKAQDFVLNKKLHLQK